MSRTITTKPDEWHLEADQDVSLDETDDYCLANGGSLRVDDARDDGEHVSVWTYPEDGDSSLITITADEALSLGQWLVKTFGSKP